MKIFRNGLCYIDSRSVKSVPENIPLSKRRFGSTEFSIVCDEKGISYLKARRDIIDYDDFCCLSDKDLQSKIDKAYKALEPYAKKIVEASDDAVLALYGDKDFIGSCRARESVYYCLLDYKNNKEEIDNTISVSICGNVATLGGVQKTRQ